MKTIHKRMLEALIIVGLLSVFIIRGKEVETFSAIKGAPLMEGQWVSGCFKQVLVSRKDIVGVENNKFLLTHQFFWNDHCSADRFAAETRIISNITRYNATHFNTKPVSEIMEIKIPEVAKSFNEQKLFGKTDWTVGKFQTIDMPQNPRRGKEIAIFSEVDFNRLILDGTQFLRSH